MVNNLSLIHIFMTSRIILFRNPALLSRTPGPVSYTHLDVYKRQLLNFDLMYKTLKSQEDAPVQLEEVNISDKPDTRSACAGNAC